MNFSDFIARVRADLTDSPVRFGQLRRLVHLYVPHINRVKLFPIDFGEHGENTAHYILHDAPEDDMREGRHDDPCFNASIRFCHKLKDDPHLFNFVMTKELMHIFDAENERVDSREKFEKLLRDAESRPVPGDDAREYRSEIAAYWRALIAICPKARRDEFARLDPDEVNIFDVSEEFLIPDYYVRTVLGQSFDQAYRSLIRQ